MDATLSKQLYTRALQSIPGGVNSPVRAFKSVDMLPLFIEKAKGSKIYDADSNEYIDYVGSYGPMILGHGHPAVLESIRNVLEKGLSFGAPTEMEITLAEMIKTAYPSVEMTRMVNSGTEAAMSAIRLARAYKSKDKIVKFIGNYHGHADYLLVKGGSGMATYGIPDSPGVPASFTEHTLLCEYNNIEEFNDLTEEFSDQIAAVIVEPFAGNMGFIPPQRNFLKMLREICDRQGILLIFDEVMTGFRVAKGGAQEVMSIMPDLTVFGKIIGGGMPVGAYGGRKEIMENVAPAGKVYQAGTLSGNPVAMAAGIATLTEIYKPGFYEAIAEKTSLLTNGLKEVADGLGIPFQVNHCGSLFGFFFREEPVKNYDDAMKSDTELFKKFFKNMLINGIYIAPSAFEAGFLSSAHSEEDIEKTISAFHNSLRTDAL